MSQTHKPIDSLSLHDKISSLTEKYKPYFTSLCKNEGWEMGIDEAGRGPVLGPMVYAYCAWPISLKEDLGSMGFFDSKQVNEENREKFFEILKNLDGICLIFESDVLDPELISNKMLQISKENLNEISYNTAFGLINSAVNRVNINNIYIDTVGKPEYYKSLLDNKFNHLPYLNFTVSEKADSKFPIVSAASIVAKVTRDEKVKNWQFRENVFQKVSKAFGSGYPADPNTVKWLEENFDQVFGYVDFVRFSWKTIENLMEKKGCRVEWIEKGPLETGCKSWIKGLDMRENFEI